MPRVSHHWRRLSVALGRDDNSRANAALTSLSGWWAQPEATSSTEMLATAIIGVSGNTRIVTALQIIAASIAVPRLLASALLLACVGCRGQFMFPMRSTICNVPQ